MKTKWKNINGWVWLVKEDEGTYYLAPWSNGENWQFPIFPTRQEARDWKKTHEWPNKKLVKARVQVC